MTASAMPPCPPSHLYPLATTTSASHSVASTRSTPAACVESTMSGTPSGAVAARSRGTSIRVPVPYCTWLTATAPVLLSMAPTSASVRSTVGSSSMKRTQQSRASA